jgi:uncharacterized protein (TIGR00369 family)
MLEMKYPNCFVCGHDNPLGLQLDFANEGETAYTWFTSPAGFEGYQGVIHGGIIATLLDEAMAKVIISKNLLAVTADMNIRYRKPLPIGQKVKVSGNITLQKTRTIHAKAVMEDENGNVYAESRAVYIVVKSF